MKRINLLTLSLFILVNTCFAQLPLTDITNYAPYLKYENHGIVEVEGVDYLIETIDEQLRVSEIKNGEVKELYEITDFPSFQQPHPQNGKFNTRSGYIVHEQYLYQVFKSSIIPVHIPTGELSEVINFTSGQLLYLTDIQVTDEMLHIEWSRNYDFTTYNLSSHEYNFLPFEKDKTYRSDNHYYAFSPGEGIVLYDAISETSSTLYAGTPFLDVNSEGDINGNKGIVFSTFSETRFINEDTTFVLSCYLTSGGLERSNFFENESYYFLFADIYDGTRLQIIDKTNCALVSENLYPKSDFDETMKVFDSPVFNNEFLIFTSSYGDFPNGQFYILDMETLEVTFIEGPYVIRLNETSFYRKGNDLYFIAIDATHPYPNIFLMALDLETYTTTVVKKGVLFEPNSEIPVSFGTSESDKTLLLTKKNGSFINVLDFEDKAQNNIIFTSTDGQNVGITHLNYLGASDFGLSFQNHNDIYSSGSDYFYDPIFEAEEISDVVTRPFEIEGLVNINDTTHHFIYEEWDAEITYTALDEYYDVKTNSLISQDYIFGKFSIEDKKYFDATSKSFEDIPIQGTILSMQKSKDHILFKSQCGSKYCLTSFTNGTFKESELTFDIDPIIHSKGNGGYFVQEKKSAVDHVIYAVGKDGIFADKVTVNGRQLNHNQQNIVRGELGAMMFSDIDKEHIIVIMQRASIFHTYTIPFEDADIYPIVWTKTEHNLVVRSEDTDDPGIYICTLGKGPNPAKLEDNPFHVYDLLESFENENTLAILIHSEDFEIAIFDTDIQETVLIKKAFLNTEQDLPFDPFSVHTKYKINEFEYVITFRHQVWWEIYENSELFYFNTLTNSIYSQFDLNGYEQTSNPHKFYETPSSIYFLARTFNDNSYQLHNIITNLPTSIAETGENNPLENVYPNPAVDFISVEVDARQLNIYDTQGHLKFSQNGYQQHSKIDVSRLNSGMFFIEMVGEKSRSIAKFVKM